MLIQGCAHLRPISFAHKDLRADLVHNKLSIHIMMAKTTPMAAVERVGARRLRDEFNCGGFAFFKQPAVLRRCKNKAGLTARFCTIGIHGDFETMIVIERRDLELNFRPSLYMKR